MRDRHHFSRTLPSHIIFVLQIWSAVRATMRGTPAKGEESGATYSGYTVFAGELAYDSPDNGEVG